MGYAHSVIELIGDTPLVALRHLTGPGGGALFAKREAHNPGGSVKDRAAYWMILAAEAAGRLKPGGVIVEPTSGNTGIGIAMVAAVRGYRAIICLPGTASNERTAILRAYGAEVVLSPADEGMSGAIRTAEGILARTPGAVMLQQFENAANPLAHVESTGPEILRDLAGTGLALRAFVATAGTGGTITGTGRFLKERAPGVRVIAVEPASSPVLSGGPAGHHRIPGMGPGFVPAILDRTVLDDIVQVSDEEAIETMRRLMREEGLLVGPSSGAAVAAALRLAATLDPADAVVTLLPDTGERYISTEAFDPPR
jgi:cysteine synthase